MFVWEMGPFGIFFHLRTAFGVGYDEEYFATVASTEPWWRQLLGGIFSCVYCLSVWVSFVFCLFYVGWKSPLAVWWLAVSAGAILINEVIGDD